MAGINSIDFDTRGNVRLVGLPMQPGAVFSKGEMLIWTATGLAPIAAGTNYAPTTDTTRIAGKATSGHLNLTTGLPFAHIDIEIAQPGCLFPFVLYHPTPASAVPTLAILGKAYELRRSTAVNGVSVPQIDLSSTADGTNACARIVDLVPSKNTIDIPDWPNSVTGAAQYSLAFAEIRASNCQFTGARF